MGEVNVGRVDFRNGDPCRPRYVDLYRDQEPGDVPLVQVEPAFQVGPSIPQLRVRVELAKGDVGFTDEDGRPLCRELNVPEYQPKIEYDGPSACVLTWGSEPAGPATRVFRIYCHRSGQALTDQEKVYGGIFVAVTTSVSLMRRHIPHEIPNIVKLRNIVVIGADQDGRPVFDVFQQANLALPPGVELAPAYRAREGKALEFEMTMGIEDACWNGKVEYVQPQGRQPLGLTPRYSPEDPKNYHFHWHTPDQGCTPAKPLEACYQGRIVTFHLKPELDPYASFRLFPPRLAHAGFSGWEDYAAALKKVNVDPTIIQPPPCDPVYKVCSY